MSVVADASAILAVLLDEPDAEVYFAKLLAGDNIRISPVNWWEVMVRMRGLYGTEGEVRAAVWLGKMGIEVEPLTIDQAGYATEAFAKYRGSPAKLNMGDCFAYGLARSKKAPLLFKGGDFTHTDITSA